MSWIKKDTHKNILATITALEKETIDVPKDWHWMDSTQKHQLHEIDDLDLVLIQNIRKLHSKHLGNPKLATLLFIKTRQLHDYIRHLLKTQGQLDATKYAKQIQLINAVIQEIGKLYRQEIEWEKAYEHFVVTVPGAVRFLHRTHHTNVPGIFEKGIAGRGTAAFDLRSTATYQQSDLQKAIDLYQTDPGRGDVAIIIEIPEKLWLDAKNKQGEGNEIADPRLGYDPGGEPFTLRPEFIVGYIDRKDNSVHLHPRLLSK